MGIRRYQIRTVYGCGRISQSQEFKRFMVATALQSRILSCKRKILLVNSPGLLARIASWRVFWASWHAASFIVQPGDAKSTKRTLWTSEKTVDIIFPEGCIVLNLFWLENEDASSSLIQPCSLGCSGRPEDCWLKLFFFCTTVLDLTVLPQHESRIQVTALQLLQMVGVNEW
jgi:hypothetical protein